MKKLSIYCFYVQLCTLSIGLGACGDGREKDVDKVFDNMEKSLSNISISNNEAVKKHVSNCSAYWNTNGKEITDVIDALKTDQKTKNALKQKVKPMFDGSKEAAQFEAIFSPVKTQLAEAKQKAKKLSKDELNQKYKELKTSVSLVVETLLQSFTPAKVESNCDAVKMSGGYKKMLKEQLHPEFSSLSQADQDTLENAVVDFNKKASIDAIENVKAAMKSIVDEMLKTIPA